MALAAITVFVLGTTAAGNSALFICGLAIMSLSAYSCWRRWEWLSIVDVYIFFIGVFFGALSLVDASLNDLSLFNPYMILLTHIHIGVISALILAIHVGLPVDLQKRLEISSLIGMLRDVHVLPVIGITAVAVMIRLYGYLAFGVLTAIPWDYLSKNAVKLPYFYTSVLMVIGDLLAYAFCVSIAKITDRYGTMKYFWSFIVLVCVTYVAIDSRRGLFYFIVIGGMIWSISRGVNPFQMKRLWAWIMTALFIFIGSNVFQTYRFLLFNPVLRDKIQDVSLIDAMLNSEATIFNLQGREATWRFNYRILNAQKDNPARFLPFGMYGDLTMQAFRNVTPRVLFPGKQVAQAEDLASMEYGFLVDDYAGNVFANTAADWGVLSLVLVPLMYLAVGIAYAFLAKSRLLNTDAPGILLVCILYYFVQIESAVDDFWLLYRNLALLACIFLAVQIVKGAVRKEPAPRESQP